MSGHRDRYPNAVQLFFVFLRAFHFCLLFHSTLSRKMKDTKIQRQAVLQPDHKMRTLTKIDMSVIFRFSFRTMTLSRWDQTGFRLARR